MIIQKNCYILNRLKLLLLFGIVLGVSSNLLHAQISEFEAKKVFEQSLSIQKSGMITLGSWALLNIFTGIPGSIYFTQERKYFHQMNAAWNTVNFGIAAFGFYSATHTQLNLGLDEMLSEMERFDRILLINTGLDLAYIGTGMFLWNRGIKRSSNRLLGYGKSILLQGGFLLAFDAILYLIHSKKATKLMASNLELTFYPTGFSIAF